MHSIEYNHLTIRTLTNKIFDIKGVILTKGISFVISKKVLKPIIDKQIETCLIYLDTGGNSLSDFNQHVVSKKVIYENSI